MQSLQRALFVTFVFGLMGCEPLPEELCSPGDMQACSGTDGCTGVQVCNEDAVSFAACRCDEGADMDAHVDERADAGSMDGGELDGGMDATSSMDSSTRDDASLDAGGDAAQSDAGTDASDGPDAGFGPYACNPVSHVPCAEDERCAWIQEAENPGTRCIEAGGLAKGTTCSNPAVGEAEECGRGTTCIGTCETICLMDDAEGCGEDEHCIPLFGRFTPDGGFALAGACLEDCNPVTQLTEDGESCGENKGCYLVLPDGTATCAKASELTQDQPITGATTSNACAPGFTPMFNAAGVLVCTARCDPVESYMGSSENLGGEAPHTCAARGASAAHECRYAWALEGLQGNDPRLNDIGICIDPTGRTYDADGDGTPETPWASCANLPNTDTDEDGLADHVMWGCAPLPQ